METFLAIYLVVGILIASFTCGLIELKSTKRWERITDRIGMVFFFAIIVASWPMIVAYLAPSASNRKS